MKLALPFIARSRPTNWLPTATYTAIYPIGSERNLSDAGNLKDNGNLAFPCPPLLRRLRVNAPYGR